MAASVDAKLLRATKFPPEFNQKVDMQKVNLQVMKKWIASRISEILGSEDDVVIELCFNLIDGPRFPDIKSLQIQLTGFLDKDTAPFCKELWKLCLSAQSSPQGVPKELLEAKKLELIQEKIDADKAAEEARIENDETVASVEAEGTTGVAADAVETELLMIAEDSGAVQVEVDPLPEGIAIHIKETVIAMCPKDVVRVGKTFGEDVPLPVQHLQTRGYQITLACPEKTQILQFTESFKVLNTQRQPSLEPISIIIVITITITIPQSKETIADLSRQRHASGLDAEEAQQRVGAGAEMPAHLLIGLVPRKTGNTPAPPDPVTTDPLIFRKMKTDPDHLNIKRPRRPRRTAGHRTKREASKRQDHEDEKNLEQRHSWQVTLILREMQIQYPSNASAAPA
ncbi:hypothetical protein F4680DRAFT_468792 [Xylaria scruposa]|nr:hypothetical protein F4680DRAFT_468792 [Xylaria scruposa]